MAIDFSRYNPPGVYVEDTTSPIVTSVGLPDAVACLVGPALGFVTATESVVISSTEGAVLSNRGIFVTAVPGPPAIAAPTVVKLDGTPLTENTDYTLSVDASGPGGAANAVTTITRVSSTTNVADGDTVTITYSYADSDYYQPQSFEDFDLILRTYGTPLTATPPTNPNDSQVASPLSYAAQQAFQNGATRVICVAVNPADGSLQQQYKAAYAKISTLYEATLVTPVFTDDLNVSSGTVAQLTTTLVQDLETHCVSASDQGYARIGIFGLPRNYSEADLTVDALAALVTNKRVMIVYPQRLQVFNSATNQITEVAGCFLAAATGGLLSNLPVNTGLTHQGISGFTGLSAPVSQKMTKTFKDTLSRSGVNVVEINRLGQMWSRHGVTTDMSSLTTREVSMIRIADRLYELVQTGMEASQLIGQPIDADMTMKVKAALTSILEQAVSSAVIVDYQNLTVTQQVYPQGDPTIIECKFAYQPAVPLNYIVISFAVNLNTGEVGDTSALATTATT